MPTTFKKSEPKVHAFNGEWGPYCGSTSEQLTGNYNAKNATCNRCLQIAFRKKLMQLVEIAAQGNRIGCNLTTFHTLRDMGKLSTLMHRNNNLFIHNNEEKQDE